MYKSSIIFSWVHPSVCPLSIHLSVILSPKPLDGIQPNLLHHFPSWLECVRATLFFLVSIHLCVRCPSICLSHYLLLNHWEEFNQTCYITSLHGKGVREQHFFFRVSVVHPSVHHVCYLLLNHWAEFNQTCYITSTHGKGVWEQHYFFHSSVWHLSVMLSPPKPLGWI